MNKKNSLCKVLAFIWTKTGYGKWILIVSGSVLLFYNCYFLINWVDIKDKDSLFTYVDPIFGITTGVLAFAIWYNDMKRNWEESLEKKLTVHFSFANQYVYSCFEAFLPHQSDIRNLGQSIGSQMNGGLLNFSPFMHLLPKRLVTPNDGEQYWVYEIHFFLRESLESKSPGHKIWYENNSKNFGLSKEILLEKRSKINLEKPAELEELKEGTTFKPKINKWKSKIKKKIGLRFSRATNKK